MSLAQVICRLVTDKAFKEQMKANPQAALAAAGLSLTDDELTALCRVPWNSLDEPDGPIGWWLPAFDPPSTTLMSSTAG